jgi:hypothetical protein
MKRKATTPGATEAAIAAFLEAHYARTLPNDVGPLLGTLASMRDGPPAGASAQRQWNKAVSVALTGQAAAGIR